MTDARHSELEQDWLRREHPDVLAARESPHAPEPMSQTPAEAADHVCRGRCICGRCWEPFSAPIHRKAARR